MLKDLNTTVTGESSHPYDFVTIGTTTFFIANDGIHGYELWKTDGTEAGTRLVKDFTPGGYESEFPAMLELGDTLMLLVLYEVDAESDGPGVALWKSDGTEAGTVLVRDFGLQKWLDHYGAASSGGSLFFALGNELWKSDGTSEGTVLVKHTSEQPGGMPQELTDVNGTLFFTTQMQSGIALWKSDGTEAGTIIIAQFPPLSSYEGYQLLNVNGRLFFSRGGTNGVSLWTSDGSMEGTLLLRKSSHYLTDLKSFGGRLLFGSLDENGQPALYASDGTISGTVVIKRGSVRGNLIELNGLIYFDVVDPVSGPERWRTDGTAAGTEMVSKVGLASHARSSLRTLVSANGRLYFQGDDETLWTSDGTDEGTFILSNQVEAEYLHVTPSHIFFANRISDLGTELWALPLPSLVVGRNLFYNNSAFDQFTPEVSQFDDQAIATDKKPYLAGGGSAIAGNVSSYSRGINGLMIDLAGTQGVISVDDFTFRVGSNNDPASWLPAPAPLAVSVRAGAGQNGSDRISIVWADGAIRDTWLQVIVEGNDLAGGFSRNTALLTSDIFYWGNKVGDSGAGLIAGSFDTTSTDAAQVYAAFGGNRPITDARDYNRDGKVDSSDAAIVFESVGHLNRLDLGTNAAAVPRAIPDVESARVAFALAVAADEPDVTSKVTIAEGLLDLLARNEALSPSRVPRRMPR